MFSHGNSEAVWLGMGPAEALRTTRSPSSALLPFLFGGRVPLLKQTTGKRAPFF